MRFYVYIIVQGIKERIWTKVLSLPVHVRCTMCCIIARKAIRLPVIVIFTEAKVYSLWLICIIFSHCSRISCSQGSTTNNDSKMPQYTIAYHTSKSNNIYCDSMALKYFLEPNKSNDTLFFLRLNILYFWIFWHLSSRYN